MARTNAEDLGEEAVRGEVAADLGEETDLGERLDLGLVGDLGDEGDRGDLGETGIEKFDVEVERLEGLITKFCLCSKDCLCSFKESRSSRVRLTWVFLA